MRRRESHLAGNESNDITIKTLNKMLKILKKSDMIHNGPSSPSGSKSLAAQTRNINKESKVKKNGQKTGHMGTTRTVKPDRKESRKATRAMNAALGN